MTSTHDEIVEKIRKCLALANGNSNLNEAAVAMEAAEKLMLKYNIGLMEVETAQQRAENPIIQSELDFGVGRGAPANWRRDLVFAIARHNFCKGFAYTGRRQMIIVGETHNIKIVEQLYVYLTREIDRLADEGYPQSESAKYYAHIKKTYGQSLATQFAWQDSSRSWKNGFRVSAVKMLDARLWKLRQGLLDTKEQGLVLAKDKRIDEAAKQMFPNATKHQSAEVYNPEAMSKGYEAGKNLPLHHSVEDSPTKPIAQLGS